MTIQQQIKEARKAAGMTQRALAERLGTSQQNVQQIEKKGRSVSLNTLQALADILGCEFVIKNKLK